MEVRQNDYQELLQKEQRRRRIRIFRHIAGIILLGILVVYLYLNWKGDTNDILLTGVAVLMILYFIYASYKDGSALISLTDELHFEDGDIIKYNPDISKTKKRIPLENVLQVYFDVTDKPNLIFVVYDQKGWKRAESFYKQRILEREKFIKTVKKEGLFNNEPITFKELKKEFKSGRYSE